MKLSHLLKTCALAVFGCVLALSLSVLAGDLGMAETSFLAAAARQKTEDQESLQSESGEDDRTRITDTTQLPYSAICRLHLVFEDEQGKEHGYAGSGYVIDSYTIATCAHCLYDHEHGYGWLKGICIEPGRNDSLRPFGSYEIEDVDHFAVEEEWLESADENSDFGLIVLHTDIAKQTGTLSLSANGENAQLTHLAGYPSAWKGNKVSGIPLEAKGGEATVKKRCLESDVYGSSGQSGSPIFNEKNEVIATYAYEYIYADRRGGPMIDAKRLSWIEANSTPARIEEKHDAAVQGSPVYRLYNPNSGEHFYTADKIEQSTLLEAGWEDEGIAWHSPVSSDAVWVYRLYNPGTGDHHYTLDLEEYASLGRKGWKKEGSCWMASASKNDGLEAVYRLYNPNAAAGAHHFSQDLHEAKSLHALGWKDENIAFYVCP